MWGRGTYLVAARTWLEAFVGEVELFHAERAGLLLVIVEYEGVLMYAFGHCERHEARSVGGCEVESQTEEQCSARDPGPDGEGVCG